MTIRILQAWNGYPQQAVVSMSSSEENRLVGLGIASFDLDGPAENLRMAQLATDAGGGNGAWVLGSDGQPINNNGIFVLKKWRLALGKALAGISNARLAFVGDSTTAGLAGGTTTFMQSIPCVSGKILNKSLLQTNLGSTFGDLTRNNPANGFPTFDPRIGGFSSWLQTGYATAGGYAFGNSANTNSLTFTPADAFDTIDIYSIDNTGGYGQWTVNVDGGATLATVDNVQAVRAIRKTTVSCTLGTHTINIQRNGVGGQVFIIGIATRNSTVKTIDIYNLGGGGSTSSDWVTSNQIQYLNALQAYAPDLTVIDIGINDRRLGLYTTTYESNLRTLVNGAKASGDVILCVPAPSSFAYSAYTTADNIAAYNAAIYRIAAEKNCPVINKEMIFQSYDLANTNGYYYDTLHPNAAGYGILGQQLSQLLMM